MHLLILHGELDHVTILKDSCDVEVFRIVKQSNPAGFDRCPAQRGTDLRRQLFRNRISIRERMEFGMAPFSGRNLPVDDDRVSDRLDCDRPPFGLQSERVDGTAGCQQQNGRGRENVPRAVHFSASGS